MLFRSSQQSDREGQSDFSSRVLDERREAKPAKGGITIAELVSAIAAAGIREQGVATETGSYEHHTAVRNSPLKLVDSRDMTARTEVEERLMRANAQLAIREGQLLSALAEVQRSHDKLESAQLRLAQTEKLEMVGRLAAGVAHEVKNPLAIVSLGIEYLTHCGLLDTLATSVVQTMKDAVKRADVVTRGLLDFSAPTRLEALPQDLHPVVKQAVSLVKHELTRNHVVLETDFADDLPLVTVDAAKMEQVFINLFMNAIHAMPDGGKLRVRTTYRVDCPDAGDACDGDGVIVVEIDDTGTGIPADKLSQLFDPFFTTKPVGIGTGLGLSITKALVELHGGTIQIANRIEGGARVSLTFKEASAIGEQYHGHEKETHSGG